MTHEEMISVIKAHAEGKAIEVLIPGSIDWHVTTNPSWNFSGCDYRIKTEPLKLVPHWPAINKNEAGMRAFTTDRLYSNEVDAKIDWKDRFIRLATEYPPIMLEAKS